MLLTRIYEKFCMSETNIYEIDYKNAAFKNLSLLVCVLCEPCTWYLIGQYHDETYIALVFYMILIFLGHFGTVKQVNIQKLR